MLRPDAQATVAVRERAEQSRSAAKAGRHTQHRTRVACWNKTNRTIECLMSLRNDVGLLTEEYDPHALRQFGNFPQAFSHVTLIRTALNLRDTSRDHQLPK